MDLGYAKLRTGLLIVKEKLGEIRASAESDDGLISATVNGRGQLVELSLDPRIYRNTDARALARGITGTVRRAAELAAQQAAALTTTALGGRHTS